MVNLPQQMLAASMMQVLMSISKQAINGSENMHSKRLLKKFKAMMF
jgi:hypothetical protein